MFFTERHSRGLVANAPSDWSDARFPLKKLLHRIIHATFLKGSLTKKLRRQPLSWHQLIPLQSMIGRRHFGSVVIVKSLLCISLGASLCTHYLFGFPTTVCLWICELAHIGLRTLALDGCRKTHTLTVWIALVHRPNFSKRRHKRTYGRS